MQQTFLAGFHMLTDFNKYTSRGGIKHWWPSYVCPSVCPVPDPKSTMEGPSKLRIGRKEANDRGDPWPHLQVTRSKVKDTRPLNVVAGNQLYLWNSKAYKLQIEYDDLHHRHAKVTSKVKGKGHRAGLGDCSIHHLQGRGHNVAAALQAAQIVNNNICFVVQRDATANQSEWFLPQMKFKIIFQTAVPARCLHARTCVKDPYIPG